ncbi:unnamed protein product [Linum tenue]|uniref:DUF7648 domain-containing protein n=1 Tax=Linum tenue TaxID=586396 RepID=A0AAV0JH30_9ROSI|nr:unnamed protein product [Linum tenue]
MSLQGEKDLNGPPGGDEMNPSSAGSEMKHIAGEFESAKLEANGYQMNGAWPHSAPAVVRIEVTVDSFTGVMDSPLTCSGAKDKRMSFNSGPDNIKLDDVGPATSPSRDMDAQELERTSDAKEAVNKYDEEKLVENNCEAEEDKQLAGGLCELRRELKQDLGSAGEQSTSSKTITTQPTLSSQCTMIPTGGKSSSNSSSGMIPKIASYDYSTSTDALNDIADLKQPVSSHSLDKDRTTNDIVSERDEHSPSRSKLLHTSASRRLESDSKDRMKHSSSKVSLAHSSKTTGSLQSDRGSNSQSRTSELNGSPSVPRVCQAGSLPQLSSPTATSLLMKRSASGSGGIRLLSPPDSRRQDTACTADVLSKRTSGGSSSKAQNVKKNTAAASTSTANRGRSSSPDVNDLNNESSLRNSPRNISDEETGPTGLSVRLINEIMSKGKRMTYDELFNAVLPHWNNLRKHNGERYAYSSHSQAVLDCLRNRHEWARLVDRGPKPLGILNHYMQTWDGQVQARKGGRLMQKNQKTIMKVGRGEVRRTGQKSVESQRDQVFLKGKRKARKRRRLALQGRGIEDVGKRQKTASLSDEDSDSFSNSSEESLFSGKDEIEGSAAAGPFRSDDSDNSSDEKRTI